MNFQQTQEILNLILNPFQSASLVNEDGKLLASRDLTRTPSTTSRLVIFQIMKKYLNPQIGDLFIVNDPDNGGMNFQNIFFTTRLTEKLFLVFVQEIQAVDFKIPPTPLFEKGLKNKMIWPFLVEQNPAASTLGTFFENQMNSVNQLKKHQSFFQMMSVSKNQIEYFKIIHEIFDRYFNNKALGQGDLVYKMSPTESIKIKLTLDDKQNLKTIYADFSQSSAAQKISAASHVIESCLVKAIADHYSMGNLLSQPLLDHIRLTLPPQSIVSKSHPRGEYNLLLQKVVSELVTFLLNSLTRQTKKPTVFKLNHEFHLDLKVNDHTYSVTGDAKKITFPELDQLVQKQILHPIKAQLTEGKVHLQLKVKVAQGLVVKPRLFSGDLAADFLIISGQKAALDQELQLKPDDVFELIWKIS